MKNKTSNTDNQILNMNHQMIFFVVSLMKEIHKKDNEKSIE